MIGTGGKAGGGFGATDAAGDRTRSARGDADTEEAVQVADKESNGGGW